ncbi:MAG: N-acetyltransferase [Caldithrix sp.]|nr:MAG: N-acetyltransferase [Caldithrix sp.]
MTQASTNQEIKNHGYFISTDQSKLNYEVVHNFITNSYWAKGISFADVKKGIENSLAFGVYKQDSQIGFARVITDYSRLAHLADVFILKEYRGLGLGKWLMENIMNHPELQRIKEWTLVTDDAHDLYRQFGFQNLKNPEIYMELKKSGSSEQ